jgi:hypothetical protein
VAGCFSLRTALLFDLELIKEFVTRSQLTVRKAQETADARNPDDAGSRAAGAALAGIGACCGNDCRSPLCHIVQVGEDDSLIQPDQIELIEKARDFRSGDNELCRTPFSICLFTEGALGYDKWKMEVEPL